MKSILETLLDNVPDFSNWNEATGWFQKNERIIQSLSPSALTPDLLEKGFIPFQGSVWKDPLDTPFGLYASPSWRKFVLATFLADWLSYPQPQDKVSFDRLLFIMHAFPQGFKTWWFKLPNGEWSPVGYTAWYPMLDTAFNLFEKSPDKVRNRFVIPDTSGNNKPFLYLFNYSIAPVFRKSPFSRLLIKTYAQEIHSTPSRGLACIVVSEEGATIASRFGMSLSGYFKLDNSIEGIYTIRN